MNRLSLIAFIACAIVTVQYVSANEEDSQYSDLDFQDSIPDFQDAESEEEFDIALKDKIRKELKDAWFIRRIRMRRLKRRFAKKFKSFKEKMKAAGKSAKKLVIKGVKKVGELLEEKPKPVVVRHVILRHHVIGDEEKEDEQK